MARDMADPEDSGVIPWMRKNPPDRQSPPSTTTPTLIPPNDGIIHHPGGTDNHCGGRNSQIVDKETLELVERIRAEQKSQRYRATRNCCPVSVAYPAQPPHSESRSPIRESKLPEREPGTYPQ
jgi:hypothetical protein